MKQCGKCQEIKPLSSFNKDKSKKLGVQSYCKICISQYKKSNNNNYKDYMTSYKIENKEKIAKQIKEYKELHKEETTLYQKKYQKKYRKSAIGKSIKKNCNHIRRTVTNSGDVTTQQLLNIQEKAKKCYWCGVLLRSTKTHIDHYVPIKNNGQHTISNLVVSCYKCNLSKGAKDPIEFANSIGKLL